MKMQSPNESMDPNVCVWIDPENSINEACTAGI